MARDEAYAFLIFDSASDELVGGITLGGVRRGVSQSGNARLLDGRTHAGKGRMTRAVAATVEFALSKLRLHRIEAACIPDNAPSIALLERNGFQREGFARGLPQDRRRLARSSSFRAGRKRRASATDVVQILSERAAQRRLRRPSRRSVARAGRPGAPRRGARSGGPRRRRVSCSPRLVAFWRTGVRGAIGQGLARFRRHRPDAGRRALQRPGRPHPGVDRARRRRHRPADRSQRARAGGAAGLDRLRADQRFRRAIDPSDRRAAFPLCRLRRRLARSRLVANRDDHRQSGRGARTRGQRGARTYSA